eukprot:2403623-Prymnesium_polylepis.1
MANTANMARAAGTAMQNARAQPPTPRTRPCTMRTRSHRRAGRQAGAGGLGWVPKGGRGGGRGQVSRLGRCAPPAIAQAVAKSTPGSAGWGPAAAKMWPYPAA